MTGVALVTGASRGIGLAIAKALLEAGFKVALNGLPDDPDLDEAVAGLGEGAVAAAFNVADLETHDAALKQVEARLGPMTTLINNAGVGVMERGDPLDVSTESWDRCMAVNARGGFFLTQAFARRLVRGARGEGYCAIVNITSSNAIAVAEPRAEYAASKAAAAMMSKTWAVRLGRENIAVYDVQPGLIETDLTAPVIEDYKARAKDGLTLIPRVGQPAEVAEIVCSLATGRLPYTTGQVISADGGLLVPRF